MSTTLRRDLPLLFLLFVALIAVHLIWDAEASRMPSMDQAAHLTKGIAYANAIRSGEFATEWMLPALYPPAYHVLLGVGTLLVGASASVGLYVNLCLLAVILVATYALAFQLADRRVALLAPLLVALYPGTALYTREALIEICLTAGVTTSLALFIASDTFARRAPTLWLGIAIGFGLLVKPSFAFHLWLPLAFGAIVMLRRPTPTGIVNAGLAAALALLVAGPWYIPHLQDVVGLSSSNRFDAIALGNPVDAGSGFQMLWQVFAIGQTTRFGETIGLIAFIASGVAVRSLWPLHASILGTWLVLVLAVVFRDDKYLLATLPPLAVLVVIALFHIRPAWLRMVSVTMVICVQAVGMCSAEFGWPNLNDWPALQTRSQYVGMHGAEPALPAIVEAMHDVDETSVSGVAVVPNTARFNANSLLWQTRRIDRNLRFEHVSYSGYFSEEAAFRRAAALNWVVLKTGDQGEPVTVDLADALNSRIGNSPDLFKLAGTFSMGDGSIAQLYRVVAPPVQVASDEELQPLVTASDVTFRGLNFGDRFRLLGVTVQRKEEGFWNARGVVIRLAWEAIVAGTLDRSVGIHLVDDAGAILAGADYPQNPRQGASVEQGVRWIDEILVREEKLTGASGIGLCLYKPDEPHLAIDRGPRDWNGLRLRIPLPQ